MADKLGLRFSRLADLIEVYRRFGADAVIAYAEVSPGDTRRLVPSGSPPVLDPVRVGAPD
jgi:hypothetical protein